MLQSSTPSFSGQVIFCGFDVHLKSWHVCVRHCGRKITSYSIPANPRLVARKLLADYPGAEIRSVYEAGFCGFEAHRILVEEFGISNIVTNPADIPTNNKERARKCDRIDCRKLARTLEAGLLEAIHVPSRQHQEFRSLVRRETQTVRARARVINQLKSHYYFNGASTPPRLGQQTLQAVHEMARQRRDFTTVSLINQLWSLSEQKKQITAWEREAIVRLNLSAKMNHLMSVPGIGFRSAAVILSEIWDIERFRTADHLASYAGFAPYLTGSGDTETTVGADQRKHKLLHYIMIQAAWRASRCDPALMCLYGKLKARRHSSQKIVCIIAKKLLFIIRAVLIEGRAYQPGNIAKKSTLPSSVEKAGAI